MTDAIAAGITGAAEASGIIQCSIPARVRVIANRSARSVSCGKMTRRIYSAVAQRLPLIPLYGQFSSFSRILASRLLRMSMLSGAFRGAFARLFPVFCAAVGPPSKSRI